MKNIGVFLSEIFQFLEEKFSMYLNRRVFVMHSYGSQAHRGSTCGFLLLCHQTAIKFCDYLYLTVMLHRRGSYSGPLSARQLP